MKYTLEGTVLEIGETQTFGESFTKRTLLVETSSKPEYPCPVPIDFIKDKCEMLDSIKVGNEIEVEFFLDGRRGKDKYSDRVFLNLRGFNFSFKQGSMPVTQEILDAADEAQRNNANEPIENSSDEISDPLPF